MMSDGLILVAGADRRGCVSLAASVAASGYSVAPTDTSTVQADVQRAHPDAIVLDATSLTPGAAAALVGLVRAETDGPLLVVVTARDQKVGLAALDAGADDFLRHPVAAPELRARLRAHLRPRYRL